MGPTLVIGCAVLSAVLFLAFGYAPWVLVVAGVPWAVAIGVAARWGHRSFGTRANTDLTIVFMGLAITAAVVVPKYAEQRRGAASTASADAGVGP